MMSERTNSFLTGKKGKITVIIAVAAIVLLIAGIGSLWSGNSTAEFAEVHITGAVTVETADNQRVFRAYRPDLVIYFSGDGERRQYEQSIIIQNVAADNLNLQVVSDVKDSSVQKDNLVQKDNQVQMEIVKLTDTSIELSVSSRTANVQIDLGPRDVKSPYHFAVIGDSQGRNEVLAAIIEEVNQRDVDFLLHMGDMVPSGTLNEYHDFMSTMESLQVPFYTVPGNHDVRGEGKEIYQRSLGPLYQTFDYGNERFVFLDSSDLTLSTEQFSWLTNQLQTDKHCSVYMHVPAVDPRGSDHGFLDHQASDQFMKMTLDANLPIRAVFSGHVHMYHQKQSEGTQFITTGGAGASLYAAPDEGGLHHYLIVTSEAEQRDFGIEQHFDVEMVPVEIEIAHTDIALSSSEQDLVVTAEALWQMETIEQYAAFENQFGNVVGGGNYVGVLIADLLEQVGGMKKEQMLVVHSADGYKQEFAYENVYPEHFGWQDQQGPMVLAISFDGETLPQWRDGYRIAFLPDDGLYGNDDSAATSIEGQGYHTYPSAGARWVKNVVRLEVQDGTDDANK